MRDDHQELFSGGKPFTLGAAPHGRGGRGAASPGNAAALSALRFKGFPSPSPLSLQRSSSVRQPESGELTAVPQHLPPGPQPRLPCPGRCSPRLRRGEGHADTASPCPGHARKLCLTLQSAQPPGTKNRSCARLDVFLSAGYTPSSRSIFSIGGAAGCRLKQRVVFHGPARRDAGQPPGNTP